MKKLAVALFAVIILISSLSISAALAGTVNIKFSGTQNVEPGQTYDYTYKMTMSDAYSFFTDISCDAASISGDLKPAVPDEGTLVNSNKSISGKFSVTISEEAKAGDKFTITVDGKYNCIRNSETGIDVTTEDIDYSYSLTVAAPEQPTPKPTPEPAPEPSETPAATPAPTEAPAPIPTEAPAPAPKPAKTEKPINSAAPAVTVSQAPSPSPSASASVINSPSDTPSPSPSATPKLENYSPELDKLNKGGTITMTLTTADSVPASTLKALKAKQATLNIDYGGYSCTIDGTNLGQISESGAYQFDMSLEKDPAISDAADGLDIYQLNFAQTGEMPGRFTYRFAASENRPGDTLYLYCYHPMSGLAEYKQSAVVDQDGYASFDIYEGLSYFVTAAPIETIEEEPGVALAAPVNDAADTGSGSGSRLIIGVVLVAITAAAIGFMRIRRIGIFKSR